MIQMQTILFVADNTGAKKVQCIKVLGGAKNNSGNIGDLLKVSIKNVSSGSKVKKGNVVNAVIVRSKKGIVRPDGSVIKFDDNAVVLLDDKHQPLGTRVFGPITRELRVEKYMKIISLALEVL